MSHLEERVLQRWSGKTIILRSLIVGLAGMAPLLLYATFGPSDGNPIGLGLLAAAVVPFALCGVAFGLVKFFIDAFASQEG